MQLVVMKVAPSFLKVKGKVCMDLEDNYKAKFPYIWNAYESRIAFKKSLSSFKKMISKCFGPIPSWQLYHQGPSLLSAIDMQTVSYRNDGALEMNWEFSWTFYDLSTYTINQLYFWAYGIRAWPSTKFVLESCFILLFFCDKNGPMCSWLQYTKP